MDQLLSIVIENRLTLALIRLLAVTDDIDVGIVEPIFFQGASLEALDQIVDFGATKIKDRNDIERFFEHFCLLGIARNAIENERIGLGMEPACPRTVMNEIAPK